MDSIYTKEEASRVTSDGPSAIVLYVCWECEHLITNTGRNASHGPRCGRCGTDMEAFNIVET